MPPRDTIETKLYRGLTTVLLGVCVFYNSRTFNQLDEMQRDVNTLKTDTKMIQRDLLLSDVRNNDLQEQINQQAQDIKQLTQLYAVAVRDNSRVSL